LSSIEWDGIELMLTGDKPEEWLHFVTQDTPSYVWEHRQNIYESKMNQAYQQIINQNYRGG